MSSMVPDYDHFFKVLIIGPAGSGKSSLLNRFVDNTFSELGNRFQTGTDFKTKRIEIHHSDAPSPSSSGEHQNIPNTTSPPQTSSTTSTKVVSLQVWDGVGGGTYQALDDNIIVSSVYRGASGVLLLYDLTNRESWDAVDSHLLEAESYSQPSIQVILVGTKLDAVAPLSSSASLTSPPSPSSSPSSDSGSNPDCSPSPSTSTLPRVVSEKEVIQYANMHSDVIKGYIDTSSKSGHNVEIAFSQLASFMISSLSGNPKAGSPLDLNLISSISSSASSSTSPSSPKPSTSSTSPSPSNSSSLAPTIPNNEEGGPSSPSTTSPLPSSSSSPRQNGEGDSASSSSSSSSGSGTEGGGKKKKKCNIM